MRGSPWPQRIDLLNIFLLLLGGLFLVSAWKLWTTAMKLEVLGPGGFPLIFSAFWVAGVGVIIVFEAIKPQIIPSYKINIHDIRTVRWLLIVFLTVLYIFVVGKIGFIVTSIVYEIVLMIGFGATKRAQTLLAIIISIMLTFSIYFSYSMFFKIPVPGAL